MVEVASLEEVPLREVWPDEAKEFTPWLEAHWAVLVAKSFRLEHRSALHWLNQLSGEGSGVHYGIGFAWPTGATNYSLRAEVLLRDGEAAYQALETQRAALDDACALKLQWEPIENARASRFAAYLDPVDPADRESWPQYRAWAIEALGELRRVFAEPIKNLP